LIKVPNLRDETAGGTCEFFDLETYLYNIIDVTHDIVELLQVKGIYLKLTVTDCEQDLS
jgi:hypothetical protein